MTNPLLLIHLRNQYTPSPLWTGDPGVIRLIDENERLEAAIDGTGDTAILTVNILRKWPDEQRIAFALHLLGERWKAPEHERLEALLRAWGSARKAKTPGHVSNEVFWTEDAVYAEAVRLAKEKP